MINKAQIRKYNFPFLIWLEVSFGDTGNLYTALHLHHGPSCDAQWDSSSPPPLTSPLQQSGWKMPGRLQKGWFHFDVLFRLHSKTGQASIPRLLNYTLFLHTVNQDPPWLWIMHKGNQDISMNAHEKNGWICHTFDSAVLYA